MSYDAHFYALTIDKVSMDAEPTRKELWEVLLDIEEASEFEKDQFYSNFITFELKHKSAQCPNWVHLHTLVGSKRPFVPYQEVKRRGYSVKFEKLKTKKDVVRWCSYIMKNKRDLYQPDDQFYI